LVAINRPKKKAEESPRRKEEKKMQNKKTCNNCGTQRRFIFGQWM